MREDGEPEAAPRVLVVDDDADLCRLLELRLGAAGYRTECEHSGEAALNAMERDPADLVVTDLRMEGMDGFGLFQNVSERWPHVPVLILTAHGSIPDAVEATRRGVFSFLTKPFDANELLREVERGLALSPGRGRSGALPPRLRTSSPAMRAVAEQAMMVAPSDVNVLIHGESGTGKEVLARAIHEQSGRSAGPFVAINCGAIPESLLESELFGHVRGAFTGAQSDREGLFREADGGSLFLDEIGDMPASLQVKLLRALQDREVRPVGGSRPVPFDVRVLSATHRDLDDLLATGEFREDLFYRIQVVRLDLPPLRERREDIPGLARSFLEDACGRQGRAVEGFAPEAMEALVQAAWPGNIRQLQNVVEQAVALSTASVIPEALVRNALAAEDERAMPTLAEARDHFDRQYLVRTLKLTGGNVSQAARIAGRNRTEFYRLLHRHALDPAEFKADE